jgi:hypothetical protein
MVKAPHRNPLPEFTDVEELHKWHVAKCEVHPAFRRVPDEEAHQDPGVRTMLEDTEESKKVARLGGNKHFAVYERLPDWNAPGGSGEASFNSHISQLWEEGESADA